MISALYRTPFGYDDIVIESNDGRALNGLRFLHGTASSDCRESNEKLEIFDETRAWLDVYFSGRDPGQPPKYDIVGLTPFRSTVIDRLAEIPFGGIVTYGDIAGAIAAETGNSRMSAQAVGGAVGWNPICIIVPCHRVVGAGGKLVGYGGGISNKLKLLENEGHDPTSFSLPR